MFKTKKQQKGIKAEELALGYLIKQNYKLLGKNFFCKYGELDLIMQKQNIIIFVEVRCRNNTSLCSPLESIDYLKTNKIKKTAEFYLTNNKKLLGCICRFDVIDIRYNGDYYSNYQINWITDAFS